MKVPDNNEVHRSLQNWQAAEWNLLNGTLPAFSLEVAGEHMPYGEFTGITECMGASDGAAVG
jgi:hypothetical protein